MSYILIDSKNYSEKKNWKPHVANISPEDKVTNSNLFGSLPVQNTYLSMVQDFGMREDDEAAVIVDLPSTSKHHLRDRVPPKQLKIIMKGLDQETYECLKDRPREVAKSGTDSDGVQTRKYLSELRDARSGFLDETASDRLIYQGVADSLPLLFGFEDTFGSDVDWWGDQTKMELD